MHGTALIVAALAVLLFGLVSRRLERTWISPPMVFVTCGMLLSSSVAGVLHVPSGDAVFYRLAQLALALVLFGDAARIDLRALRTGYGVPLRLLVVGMPLTIAAGGGVALWLFPSLGLGEALLLGALLAPTDATLGQDVVSHPKVPLRVRQGLNVESGLNDGMGLPAVLFLAAYAGVTVAETPANWPMFAATQLALGPMVGAVAGWSGGQLVGWADGRGWMLASFERLAGLAIAVFSFAAAERLGGNGFLAAFAAGLTLGNTARGMCSWLYDFLEAEGQLLTLLVFMLIGATFAWPALESLTWQTAAYAALSLTAVRMVPVGVACAFSGLRAPTVAYLGWFGPRGLASVLMAILVVRSSTLPHAEALFSTVVLTVLASVFLHGVTAPPLAELYGRAADDRERCPSEHQLAGRHPLRLRKRR